ncbi:type VII secretion protein EccCa [Actinomadura spongiicola]|uniref:Type VII secretion protein EccCa n=1 Tax=Actinomadura spongiicola TaxID=2303421 RepID=A0A372GKI9_9ACTN|nr:type VII secretion protein EccCa [Actinomadura spongiicola]RFS85890.1 type VII secretion protein EccCa [Actinomadura spongiicola]
MTIRVVHRPARTILPPPEPEPRLIEAPPTLPEEGAQGNQVLMILPMVGMMASLAIMTVLRNPAFMVFGAVLLVVAVLAGAAMLLSRRGQVSRQRRAQRERYLEYLETLREELAAWEAAERARARVLDPPPEALYDIVRDPTRLWERRRRQPDFLRVRVGTGFMPGAPLDLGEQGTALTPTDPFMLAEARAVMDRFRSAPDMPLTLPLDMAGNVSVVGTRQDVLRLMRALLAQFAAFHSPQDVAVAVACGADRAADWDWVKWLPHVLDRHRHDGGAPVRLIAPSPLRLAALLADDLRERTDFAAEVRRGLGRRDSFQLLRRLLVVHDTHGEVAADLVRPDETVPPADLGATIVHLVADQRQEPGDVSVRIRVDGDRVEVEDLRDPAGAAMAGTVDDVPSGMLVGLTRMLAPLRLSRESAEESAAEGGEIDFTALWGVDDPAELDVSRMWAPRSERAFLRVPIGLDDAGEPVVLDLKEAASLGMGPHGLCVGATGSGKSEMLRTLVLTLAATHPPEQVSMVLVDYKGGATFAPFADLPHVAGVITNLEDDAGLIERAYASLSGEVQRRQQLLRDAGNIANIGDYAFERTRRPELAPLPYLLVIIDEFGELLTARPDFIELFLSIGRIGRSIGVHLLLSSQRIESGKLRGLETYLSYRLGLRTFSEEESRTVLDTPDAFHLPALPGFGYLKVDTSVYQRFKSGYVSGPYRGPVQTVQEGDKRPPVRVYTAYNVAGPPDASRGAEQPDPGAALPERSAGPRLLDVMVAGLVRHGRRIQDIWLPPLPALVTLDGVTGPVRIDDDGMRLPVRVEPMRVPIGLLDDARRQWQGVWYLDLASAGGHVALIGGPQTGKTTLLRTLVLSLALTHSPAQAAVYGLDLLGGGLQALAGLPNVGGIAGRSDRERVRRTVEEVHGMLDHRQEVFRRHGIDSVQRLRSMHAAGRVPELPAADVVLVVDGFGAIRADFEEIDEMITDVLTRGGGYGVHLVAGMLRWNDVRMSAQSMFGRRVELRLNDPADSTVERKLAQTIGASQPGRALTDDKLFAQVSVPALGHVPDPAGLGAAVEAAVGAVRSAWTGPVAPPVRVLPHRLDAAELPGPAEQPHLVPIGLEERSFEPVLLDLFGTDQNLLVLGDGGCGKSALLRLIARSLVERYTPEQVVFAVMDPRRSLGRDVVPEPYLGGYATTPRVCTGLAAGVAKELEGRMPEPDDEDAAPDAATAGPRIVVLVDDYDLLTTAGQQPMAPFVPFVPNGPDIGLHFVVTRRVAGASRGLYDPLVQSMREIGTGALLMSGDRSEGQIFPRVHADPLPPGRGKWIRRGEGPRLVQAALSKEENP